MTGEESGANRGGGPAQDHTGKSHSGVYTLLGRGCLLSCILSASLTFRGKGAQGLTPGPPSGWSVEEPWERNGPCSPTDPGSCHSGLWLWARHLTVLSLSFPLCKMGQWQLVRRLGTEAGTSVE